MYFGCSKGCRTLNDPEVKKNSERYVPVRDARVVFAKRELGLVGEKKLWSEALFKMGLKSFHVPKIIKINSLFCRICIRSNFVSSE